MRLIFLDFDGVLNTHEAFDNGYCAILISKVQILNKLLLSIPDSQIVISSAWRYTLNTIASIETVLGIHGCHCNDRIHGLTEKDELTHDGPMPLFGDREGWTVLGLKLRAKQIKKYVEEHKPLKWVAFDDLALQLESNFVKIDPDVGLTEDDINKAIEFLR